MRYSILLVAVITRISLMQHGPGQEQPGAGQSARLDFRSQSQLFVNRATRVAECRNSRHQRRPGYGSYDRIHLGSEFIRKSRRVSLTDMV